MSDDYEVPTKAQLLAFAEKVAEDPDDLFDAEFTDYSEDINELLLELRDGEDLTDDIRRELSDLYDEWEAEDFPVAVEEDSVDEGGPKGPAEPAEDDPDMLPDPEDV
jgi:hypothetical protein